MMASRTEVPPQSVQRSRQLDFNKAMSDFKVMFPTFDYEVIEMVLRANNGLVDATVDQLLEMQAQTNEPESKELLDPELNVRLPSYSDTSAATFEPPPAYTPRIEEDPNFSYDSTFLETGLGDFNTSFSQRNTPPARTNNTHFHPPLLGTLPRDFLRINLDDRPSSSEGMASENPLYEVSSLQRGHQWTGSSVETSRVHQGSTVNGFDQGFDEIPSNETGAKSCGRKENPLYEVSSLQRGHQWMGSRVETSRVHQDVRPNTSTTVSSSTVNGFDQGFDEIPSNETGTKSCGKKGKGKKFGQMSRKFRRKKTKNAKGTTYQQMSGTNLIDEDSGDEHDVQR